MMKTYTLFICLVFLTISTRIVFCQESCTDPFGEDGLCVLPEKCPRIAPLLNNKNMRRNDSILLSDSFCGNVVIDQKPRFKVCCDKSTIEIESGCLVPDAPEHGTYKINETTPKSGSKVPHKTVLIYQCDDNYRPEPFRSAYCQKNDKWIYEITCIYQNPLKNLTIISRLEWSAQPSNGKLVDLNLPVDNVNIKPTFTEPCSDKADCTSRIRIIQTQDMERNFTDIRYNFVIGGDGLVYECRGWDKVGEHNQEYNGSSIEIGLIGIFASAPPPEYQLLVSRQLIHLGITLGKIKRNFTLYGNDQKMPSQWQPSALSK